MIEINAMKLTATGTYVYDGYTHTQTIASGSEGEPYYVPPALRQGKITLQVDAGDGSAVVKYTADSRELISEDGASFDPLPDASDLASVTGVVTDVIVAPLTGFRVDSVAGAVTVKVII